MAHAALSGLLLSLSARGELHGIVACFALIPLAVALRRTRDPLQAGLLTFTAQLGLLMTAFEGALPVLPWTFPLLLLLSAPGAMFPGVLYFLFDQRIAHAWGSSATASLWVLPFSWTASEFLASRREIWGQFASPVALGYTQFDSPLMMIAGFSGVTGVTLAVLVANVAFTQALLSRRLTPLLPAAIVGGLVFVTTTGDGRQEPSATIGIVQPALESHWYDLAATVSEAREEVRGRLVGLSREVARADLIVWPEGALPGGSTNEPFENALPQLGRVDILAGAITFRNGRRFNSVVHISAGSTETVFDKLAPVPIGESAFSPGHRLTVGRWGGVWAAPLICLDSLYPLYSRRLAALGADVLVVVSDDSFARRTVTPRMHLRTSAFRAAETGVPLAFVSAHGPSGVFGAQGELLARTEFGNPSTLLVEIPPSTPTTFYVRYGEFIGYLSVTITAGLMLFLLFRGTP